MADAASLDEIVRDQRVVVCVGSGGVGKTTVSASIAMKAAQMGRRACVLTIDPARRLANAMGLRELGNTPSLVDASRFETSGLAAPAGRLYAMMLDTKRTWDDLVHRFAATPEQAQRILDNKYYRQISTSIAGSQEFMAMEKLLELHESGQYDLLVLDTPPTRHALDFLEAPKRMIGFMDDRVLRFLTTPARVGKFGIGMLTSSTAMMFAVLQRVTGFEVLSDISDYVSSFSGMHAGFRERAARVEAHLRSPSSTFILVASPNAETVEEAIFFYGKLRASSMPFGGFVVNRAQESALGSPDAAAEWDRLRQDPSPLAADRALASRLADNFAAYEALASAHAAHLAHLAERCPGAHFRRVVPAFDDDVHDLSGLARVNTRLFTN
ncbi:MAG TPA: ArsA-related P-loop ATPase [Vicinamibacterales bacterium]|jgi:anion-transporting  ArsA/GET3 family ATPase|nr:ArsA-related P-loop ATPase [Vicinamibacterales bacterium]